MSATTQSKKKSVSGNSLKRVLSPEGREQIGYKVRKFIFGSKDSVGKLAAVYLLLISIGFVYLYPVLYMISKSFMNLNDLLDTSINWIPSELYLDNYKQAFQSMDYWKTFRDSVVIAGIPTLINVVVCAIVGYGFARSGRYVSSASGFPPGQPVMVCCSSLNTFMFTL